MSYIWLVVFAGFLAANESDWPVYRHDAARSGATAATTTPRQLAVKWTYRSPIAPQPAWDATARQDAYHGIRWLPERRLYDAAFEPIIVGQTVYFGSSADDTLRAVDLAAGKIRWQRTLGGPIRIAPAYHNGKLYFGCDDGFAYCLDADNGDLVWRYTVAEPARLVLQDGRFISPLACRTGVVVKQPDRGEATAYFCQSLLPWDESYLCAVDAQTGKPTGDGRFVRAANREGHFDGPLSATDKLLYCPRGNTAANMFTLREAAPLGNTWAATGGCFALFFPDENRIMAGGFAYQGKAALLDAPLSGATGPDNVRYVLGVATACYRDGILYLQFPDKILAVHRATGKQLWESPLGATYCVVATGDAVFVGGDDRIVALDLASGKTIWQHAACGRVYALAAVQNAVIASTDLGEMQCFQQSNSEVAIAEESSTAEPANPPAATADEPLQLPTGPSLRFSDANRAEISWTTRQPSPTIIEFGAANKRRVIRDDRLATSHRVVVDGLVPRRVYPYRIQTQSDGKEEMSAEFTCDTYLNYSVPSFATNAAHGNASHRAIGQAAAYILQQSKADHGLCLVLGAGDQGALAWQLARQTHMRVLIVDEDQTRIESARQALLPTGAYGARVAALQVKHFDQLPLPSHSFRLIVSADSLAGSRCPSHPAEIQRLLDPARGVAIVGQPTGATTKLLASDLQQWLAPLQAPDANQPAANATVSQRTPTLQQSITNGTDGVWATLKRSGGLPGAQPWSHQYASVENTACSNDTLQGAAGFSQFTTQWLGRPGGRYQADRMVRKPAPLAANGRLIMQGQGNLICVDSASGAVLWTLEIPGLGRYNVVRDASNYCTDGEHLFLAHHGQCWVIDLETGSVEQHLPAAPLADEPQPDWSYIATIDDLLVGSATTPGTAYTNTWGGGAWYEHSGWEKVCSSSLFALDKNSGTPRWQYSQGAIVNTTIVIGAGRIYFLESRQPEVVADKKRMLNGPELWSQPWLVALDLATGKKLWERSFAAGEFPSAQVMCGMVFSRGKIIFHGSTPATTGGGPKGYYHLRAFDAASGVDAWKLDEAWAGYGHGTQTSYPVVVGDEFFYSPRIIRVDSGECLPMPWNEGHCGTTSASCHALFYRFTTIAAWDIAKRTESRWPTVRPDCWLSAIPAEGLLLAPEGGGGCVCGGWLETSAAMAPRTDFALFRTRPRKFLKTMEVELEPPVGGGVTHITIDGSAPTRSSPRYEQPIHITETTTVRTLVFGGPDAPQGGPEIAQTFERLAPAKFPTAGRIEFQPILIDNPAPDDLLDVGESLGIRPNGYVYGWQQDAFGNFWTAVDPSRPIDPIDETLVWFNANNQWQMALANGNYEVTLLVGNPQGETKQKDAGAVLVGDVRFELQADLAKGEMTKLVQVVPVTDGVLRLAKPTGDRTSTGIAWLQFRKLDDTASP